MESLQLVRLKNVPILQQLQWEEALLRADGRNWCLINEGSSSAIVMGISGSVNDLVDLSVYKENPIPLIRRFSGGGTVVVDESTFFATFIFNHAAHGFSPYPPSIMQWTERFYQGFLPSLFKLCENDYVIDNKKVGGNAQSIIKNRWLHHSSFLWDYCEKKMQYLLYPAKTPQYRQRREHADFLGRLKEHYPDLNALQKHFVERLKEQFHVQEKTVGELIQTAQLPHRQSTKIIDLLS